MSKLTEFFYSFYLPNVHKYLSTSELDDIFEKHEKGEDVEIEKVREDIEHLLRQKIYIVGVSEALQFFAQNTVRWFNIFENRYVSYIDELKYIESVASEIKYQEEYEKNIAEELNSLEEVFKNKNYEL